jgi:hypothetical protein
MTQRYYGSKIVTAWKAELKGKPGYSVKYPDGYTSWSPKKTFEDAYLPMGNTDLLPGWQERIVAEFIQLDSRLVALEEYLLAQDVKQTIDEAAMSLLQAQAQMMHQYHGILKLRLKLHGVTPTWKGPNVD